MDIAGNLEAMDLPTLVQFIVQDGHQAVIRIEQDNRVGKLYFDEGQLCHAVQMTGETTTLSGEEAVYELLTWRTGRFQVEKEIKPPTTTIQQNWGFLLMEGLRRRDERFGAQLDMTSESSLVDLFSDITDFETADFDELALVNKEQEKMANIEQTLEAVMKIEGAIAAALVDWESGLTLGTIGSGMNIDLAAAGNTNVVRAKMSVMKDLKLKGGIEDILITLTEQYHLIRMLHDNPSLFLYLALDRSSSNLDLARHRLNSVEKELVV